MAERPWGFWTESKLDMLSAYLPAFTTASKNKASATVYLDLFAGQELNVGRHTGEPIKGSLRRALETVPQFSVLRGFELRRDRAASLEGTYRADFPQRDVRVLPGDVHEELEPALRRLSNLRWAPTFAFIDPDGVEARWSLLESLAAYKHERSTKVELFMLLLSPQIGRVVHGYNDAENKARAEQHVTDLFGSEEWRPILRARQAGELDPERARDELTNLMRWRMEQALGYRYTHTVRLTNTRGAPLYDMVFATDHEVGHRIMRSVYRRAAESFPQMRQQARARLRDRAEAESGSLGLFTTLEALSDAPLSAGEGYEHTPPSPPFRGIGAR